MEAAKRRWKSGPKADDSGSKSKFEALLKGKGGPRADKLAALEARKRQDREDSKYDAMLASSVMKAGGRRGGGGRGGGGGSIILDEGGGGGGMLDVMERKLQAAREKDSGASRRPVQPQSSAARASKANATAAQLLRARLVCTWWKASCW